MSEQENTPRHQTDRPAAGSATIPRITRTHNDKVIAGVAGGLGRYFRIDPILIRIAFVALAFTGIGILIYLACWLLIPQSWDDPSTAPKSRIDAGRLLRYAGVALIAIVAVGMVGDLIFDPFGEWVPQALVAAALIGFGVMLLNIEDDRDQPPGHTDVAQPTVAQPDGGAVATESLAVVKRRERSPLGWLGLGSALLLVSAALIVNRDGSVFVDASDIAGLFLTALGAAVLIGAWWGRARWLIPIGLLALPFAVMASAIDIPLRGSVGSFYVQVESADDLRPYELLAGDLTIDLTDYDFSADPNAHLDVRFVAGQVHVVVPDEVYVRARADMVGGQANLFNESDRGVDVTATATHGEPGSSGSIVIDIDGGFGDVMVDDGLFLGPKRFDRFPFRD